MIKEVFLAHFGVITKMTREIFVAYFGVITKMFFASVGIIINMSF